MCWQRIRYALVVSAALSWGAGHPIVPALAEEPPVKECAGPQPYKYVGNNFSYKFHRPSCPFARAMNVHHVELFHFRREAIAAGQTPCRYCLPPFWKTVKVEMIPPAVPPAESADSSPAKEQTPTSGRQ